MQSGFFVKNDVLKIAALFYLTKIKRKSINNIKPIFTNHPILQHFHNDRQSFCQNYKLVKKDFLLNSIITIYDQNNFATMAKLDSRSKE